MVQVFVYVTLLINFNGYQTNIQPSIPSAIGTAAKLTTFQNGPFAESPAVRLR